MNASGRIRAKVEADFAGGFPNSSTAARQPQLRLRHAWVEIANPRWEFRFGQDWALISGPFPNTASFVVGAGKGNLWMRFPQIRAKYNAGPVRIAASLNRPMAGNTQYDAYAGGDFDMVGDGERSGLPWTMARIWLESSGFTLSASGHYGLERVDDLSGAIHDVQSYSANLDLQLTLGPAVMTVKGFVGENLNSFLGGVFQGITRDSVSVSNVKSAGGWAQVLVRLHKQWAFTAGGGMDNPSDDTLLPDMRSRNDWLFTNLAFTMRPSLKFLLEASFVQTAYSNDKTGKNMRIWFVTLFTF